ncbi:MAG: pantetheine-phosphate adenylyltransferase [Deltaproteobacteria bacterium]|jgi:pantetheine-phosphate adenylyltransferase|nr:pantetheine-phosphate adenylyltransferase [Deltaproteobacteria bacterium]
MTLTALYPGSFDPITNGHLDIILRALGIVDRLIIGIARNARKEPLFSVEERMELIREAVNHDPRAEVSAFEGLTVQYAARTGARMIIRGLRAVADFEYELQMANMNRKLEPKVETYFMMTSEKFFFVSSQNVKEVASLGGDVSCLVPPHVAGALTEKFSG